MSHSLLHQEKRRRRAKLKAKENRIYRNSPHLFRESPRTPLAVQSPRSLGFLGSIWLKMQSLLHSLDLSVRKLPVQEVIHSRGWLKRQQRTEAHKKQRSKEEK